MGMFLQTALVLTHNLEELKTQIVQLEKEQPDLILDALECQYWDCDKGIRVLFNKDVVGYEGLAKEISVKMQAPILLLYIFDGDFWGYFFYENGMELDRFSPMPDYFTEDIEEIEANKGNAVLLAEYFHVEKEMISPYLRTWTEDLLDGPEIRAHEKDEAPYGDCWQMADFIEKLGFPYEDKEASLWENENPSGNEQAAVFESENFFEQKQQPVTLEELRGALDTESIAEIQEQQLQAKEAFRLMEIGRYKEAVSELTELLKKEPENTSLYIVRSFCYKMLRRKVEMERDLENALRCDPDNILVLRERCPTAATTNRYRRHVVELTRLMELDKENYKCYLLSRAWRYYWIKDFEAAKADMEELIQLGPPQIPDFTALYEELKNVAD